MSRFCRTPEKNKEIEENKKKSAKFNKTENSKHILAKRIIFFFSQQSLEKIWTKNKNQRY